MHYPTELTPLVRLRAEQGDMRDLCLRFDIHPSVMLPQVRAERAVSADWGHTRMTTGFITFENFLTR